MTIKIYVNYFNPSHIIQSGILTPIQVGRAISKTKLDMIGDDTGDNISAKNPSYCELTGQYWAWKNDTTSDYLGFMHYRRFLDFYPNQLREYKRTSCHGITEAMFEDGFSEKYGLIDEHMEQTIQSYDMILPEPFDFRTLNNSSIEDQYKCAPDHHIKDFKIAQKIIAELYPEDSLYFEKMAATPFFYPANIFIFKRTIFEEYCTWLFPLLEKIEALIDTSSYNAREKRVTGYLAERLFTLFILKKLDTDPQLTIKHLPRLFVEDTDCTAPPPLPTTDLPIVSLGAATDVNYLPHLSALVVSVLKNADHNKFIDFIIFENNLTASEKSSFVDLQKIHPHCKISFVDISRKFLTLQRNLHFSRTTFCRLLLADIITNRDKFLFLDTDMVVLGNVGELFEVDLAGKMIAATRDLVMQMLCNTNFVKTSVETNEQLAREYVCKYLKLDNASEDYFQAGTILFNLKKLRSTRLCGKMINDIYVNNFWFVDQDVLNKYLLGQVNFIDNSWNTMAIDKAFQSFLSPDSYKLYNNAQQSPKIIHFAGVNKPWENSQNPFCHYYWYYLRQTIWYEHVLFQRIACNNPVMPRPNSITKRILRKIWRAFPQPVKTRMQPIAEKIHQTMA